MGLSALMKRRGKKGFLPMALEWNKKEVDATPRGDKAQRKGNQSNGYVWQTHGEAWIRWTAENAFRTPKIHLCALINLVVFWFRRNLYPRQVQMSQCLWYWRMPSYSFSGCHISSTKSSRLPRQSDSADSLTQLSPVSTNLFQCIRLDEFFRTATCKPVRRQCPPPSRRHSCLFSRKGVADLFFGGSLLRYDCGP